MSTHIQTCQLKAHSFGVEVIPFGCRDFETCKINKIALNQNIRMTKDSLLWISLHTLSHASLMTLQDDQKDSEKSPSITWVGYWYAKPFSPLSLCQGYWKGVTVKGV